MSDHWEIIDHVCGGCAGRLVRQRGEVADMPGRHWLYRCTNCGMIGVGESKGHPINCGCDYKIGDPKTGGRPSGVRCAPNLNPTPDNPAEIIVQEV